MKFSMEGLDLLKAMKDHSYMCSTETDILVDVTHNVIVRMLGVQVQAFDIKNDTFSKRK